MEDIDGTGSELGRAVQHLLAEGVGSKGLEDVGGVDCEQGARSRLRMVQQTMHSMAKKIVCCFKLLYQINYPI